ncbi:unnamed protein product, partial [Staurois parvus]
CCQSVPPISASQCRLSVPSVPPISSTYQCRLSVPYMSAAFQCPSVLPVNAYQCHLSVPISTASLAHISEGEKSLTVFTKFYNKN